MRPREGWVRGRVNPLRLLRVYWDALKQIMGAGHRHDRAGHRLCDEHVGPDVHAGHLGRRAGGFFAFLSPLIGWFGTAVTGSDTSTNSLFGALQVMAAKRRGSFATVLAAANSSGGVLAKMVSPQNRAIGASAVGLAGREGDIFRKVIGWSVALVLLMAVLVLLQAGLLVVHRPVVGGRPRSS